MWFAFSSDSIWLKYAKREDNTQIKKISMKKKISNHSNLFYSLKVVSVRGMSESHFVVFGVSDSAPKLISYIITEMTSLILPKLNLH